MQYENTEVKAKVEIKTNAVCKARKLSRVQCINKATLKQVTECICNEQITYYSYSKLYIYKL